MVQGAQEGGVTFSDTGKQPVLTYLGETGNSGLLAGGGKPLPGWCSISVDTGKLVFYLDGLGSKTVDPRAAQLVNLPGALKTDSGGFTLQMFSPPFAHNGAVCCFVTHFRGTWQGGSANDNTRDLFLLATPFAVGTQDGPVDPPAPPGGAVDLSPVIQAIAAARGPLDGKDAPDNSIAGVKNTGNAIYDRLGIKAGDSTAGQLLREIDTTVRASSALLSRPPESDFGLPDDLAKNLGTDYQRYLAWTIITVLEFLTRLPEFPRSDGGTILRT
jgi:hypothetical protein